MDVRLRAIEEEDLPQLRDWRNSDWLRPYVREYRLLSIENQKEWFHYISTSRDIAMFGIEVIIGELPSYRRLIGACGLCTISWVNRTAEVSIYVIPEYQRRGIGSKVLALLKDKAFGEFNLHRLWAEVYSNNLASTKLFDDAGYGLEGTLRHHVFKEGYYRDSFIYGLLREE